MIIDCVWHVDCRDDDGDDGDWLCWGEWWVKGLSQMMMMMMMGATWLENHTPTHTQAGEAPHRFLFRFAAPESLFFSLPPTGLAQLGAIVIREL